MTEQQLQPMKRFILNLPQNVLRPSPEFEICLPTINFTHDELRFKMYDRCDVQIETMLVLL